MVTASVGVGVATSDGDAIADGVSLIAAADEAAYVSKFAGKNRTTAWPIEPNKKRLSWGRFALLIEEQGRPVKAKRYCRQWTGTVGPGSPTTLLS